MSHDQAREELATEIETRTIGDPHAAVSRQMARKKRENPPLPLRLGRYRVREELGAGAMGRVLLANDTELEREVAIKVLHETVADNQRLQLIVEAQAMARLTHPNVVTVYDVGEQDRRVFIAMEYVRGPTLRRWQRQSFGDWRKTLAIYLGAGRGLEAAHLAGMVHRDFKPDNVLVSETGIAKVTDFGLAELIQLAKDTNTADDPDAFGDECATQRSTKGRVGTPAYMAPECIMGLVASPHADQFAFCIALWEALHGLRPFRARNVPELFAAITMGRRSPTPEDTKVPRELRKILERGFSVDSQHRFGSMTELCAELERVAQPFVRRYAFPLVGAGLAGAIALGASASAQFDSRRCHTHADAVEQAWGTSTRAAVHDSFANTGLSYAEDTSSRIDGRLSEWSEAWRSARLDVCDAPRDDPDAARTSLCLDDHLQQLHALVEVLSQADPIVAEYSLELVSKLPPVAACNSNQSTRVITNLPPTDPEARATLRRSRTELVRVGLLLEAGEHDDALELAQAQLEQATSLAYPPLLADALLHLGRVQHASHEPETAQATLLEAFFTADRADLGHLAVETSNELSALMSGWPERSSEGLLWSRIAADQVARLGPHAGLLEAEQLAARAQSEFALGQIHTALATSKHARERADALLAPEDPRGIAFISQHAGIFQQQGEFDKALALRETALARTELVFGRRHPRLARELIGLGMSLAKLDHLPEAQAAIERSLDINIEAFGDMSIEASRSLLPLGNIAFMRGRPDRAVELFEQALAIRIRVYGPDHSIVQGLRANIGVIEQRRGNIERAKDLYEQALAATIKAAGPDHPSVADTLINVASVYHDLGEYETSLAHSKRALEIYEQTYGPTHPSLGIVLTNLASVSYDMERCPAALEYSERAIKIMENKLGKEHSRLVIPLFTRGQILHCLERDPEAELVLSRAQSMADAERYQGIDLAQILYTRGLVRDKLGQNPAGRELIQRALLELDTLADPESNELREEINAWLAGGQQSAEG